jgi:ABC-type iron transport system FetAB ATPase subunit
MGILPHRGAKYFSQVAQLVKMPVNDLMNFPWALKAQSFSKPQILNARLWAVDRYIDIVM